MDCNKDFSSLHNHNIDEENFGKNKKNLKDYFLPRENVKEEMKIICSKATQVNFEEWVSDGDHSSDVPTKCYWKILAEKKRMALENALTENEQLWILHETLTKENSQNRQLLEEANSFIEVFKEVVQDTADDTGIDIRDVSIVNNDNSPT